MRFDLGLTGSIGMGKSTTARLFSDRGCAVWDADAAVHRLYEPGAKGSSAIAALCPEAVGLAGVDRIILKTAIAQEPSLLKQIEAAIHPLVADDRAGFKAKATGICVFDIPLLFEKGSEAEFDAVACVSVPADIQRQRVLDRPGMTEDTFDMILSKQMPNAEKVRRSDYVIDTSTPGAAARDVDRIVQDIQGRMKDA